MAPSALTVKASLAVPISADFCRFLEHDLRAASRLEHRSRNRQISADMGTAGPSLHSQDTSGIVADLYKAGGLVSAPVHPMRTI